MANSGVLILSHCGFSFAEDLIAAIKARGLQPFVLSSLPLPEHGEQRLQKLRSMARAVLSSDSHVLNIEDVERAIASLRASGRTIGACISVWEGYRGLMAHANQRLGVSDLPARRIDFLRNKFAVRSELYGAGLSKVAARILTPEVLETLKREGGRYFVKPARGIASYGAFRLAADTSWARLAAIVEQARDDTVYGSALGEDVSFVAEDYLEGTEFSFEVLAAQGEVHIVGLHEKCELTETNGTVLEDSCTSPPASLSTRQIAAGLVWLRSIFTQLQLDWGCFHVEARFDGKHWDLIEINPRVGGSLISHSVKALNAEASLLDLWLALLLEQTNGAPYAGLSAMLRRLSYRTDGSAPTALATFFRVYFAAPGQIESIELRAGGRRPAIEQILLKPGDVVDDTPRESFLGQLLWRMTRDERDASLNDLLVESASAIDVRYRNSSLALETQS